MLPQTMKTAIRRHLGVPFSGNSYGGRLYGWRFTFYREDLEYRMNNMTMPEEQLITGYSLGAYKIQGNPTVEDVLNFTLNYNNTNYNASYTVRSQDFSIPPNPVNPPDSSPLYSIALNSANAISQVVSPIQFAATGVMPADLMSPQFMPPYFAEVYVAAPGNFAFTLTESVTGTTNLSVENPGTQSPVVGTFQNVVTGASVTLYGYVAILDYLAMNMTQQGLSLWLTQAGPASFQDKELPRRRALYKEYCTQLAQMIGGMEYVQMFGGSGRSGSVA